MNKLYILLLTILCVCACKEEVQPFSGKTGLNFLGYNTQKKQWDNSTAFLFKEVSFQDSLSSANFPMVYLEIPLRVEIEGLPLNKDAKINLIAIKDKNLPLAKVEIPSNLILKAGETILDFKVKLFAPPIDTQQGVKIQISSNNSDLENGVLSRQEFVLTSKNEIKYEFPDYGLTKAMFIEAFERFLGSYSVTKHEFCISNTKVTNRYNAKTQTDEFFMRVAYTALAPTSPDYGLGPMVDEYKKALETYNASHNTPLKDDKGNDIVFP